MAQKNIGSKSHQEKRANLQTENHGDTVISTGHLTKPIKQKCWRMQT
jgi:hypothetical protein